MGGRPNGPATQKIPSLSPTPPCETSSTWVFSQKVLLHTHSMALELGVVSGLTAQSLDTLLRVLADSGAFHDAWWGRVDSRPISLGHDQPSLAVTLYHFL